MAAITASSASAIFDARATPPVTVPLGTRLDGHVSVGYAELTQRLNDRLSYAAQVRRHSLSMTRNVDYLGGGGVIMDMAVHAIDLLRYVLADEVEAVGSFQDHLVYSCEAEDTAVIHLRFRGGTLGTISVSGGIPYGRNALELYSDRGAILSERSMPRVPDEVRVRMLRDGTWTEHTAPNVDCFRTEIERFVASLDRGGDPPVTGSDGRQDLAVALAAYRSMRERRLVRPDEMTA